MRHLCVFFLFLIVLRVWSLRLSVVGTPSSYSAPLAMPPPLVDAGGFVVVDKPEIDGLWMCSDSHLLYRHALVCGAHPIDVMDHVHFRFLSHLHFFFFSLYLFPLPFRR